MKMKLFYFAFLLVWMSSCKDEKPAENTDVYEIRNIGLLSTTEYTVGKVIKLKDNKAWYKYGDRNILISCKARIKAGVDLGKLSDQDIVENGKRITITLPAPEILSLSMDPNLIRTEMEDVNGFREGFSQEEKNLILVQGEQSIRDNIGETSILETAGKNARTFITDFYKQLGFDQVTVIFKQPYEKELSTRTH